MAPRRLFVSAIAGAALAIAVFIHATVAPVGTARAAPAQAGSLVAFQSDRDGDSEIWVVSDNGSAPRRLTSNRKRRRHSGLDTRRRKHRLRLEPARELGPLPDGREREERRPTHLHEG